MSNCSKCKENSSSKGCNCGSLGCTVILNDDCIKLKEGLDVCGVLTIPAGTDYNTALQQAINKICELISA